MKYLGLYAILRGVSTVAQSTGVSEDVLNNIIDSIDIEPFFVRIRELIFELAKRQGIERTAEVFKLSPEVVQEVMDFYANTPTLVKAPPPEIRYSHIPRKRRKVNPEAEVINTQDFLKRFGSTGPSSRQRIDKETILKIIEEAKDSSPAEVAKKYDISSSKIRGWMRTYFATGNVVESYNVVKPTASNALSRALDDISDVEASDDEIPCKEDKEKMKYKYKSESEGSQYSDS